MDIKYGRGWGGARISLSRGSVLSREYFPSSLYYVMSASSTDHDPLCIVEIVDEIGNLESLK